MKRIFTILALAAAFSLAVPATSEAAPRKDKHKSSHVSKHRSHKAAPIVAARSGGRVLRHAVVTHRSRHHHGAIVRSGPNWYGPMYWPAPVLTAPDPWYYGPRRGLLWFRFSL